MSRTHYKVKNWEKYQPNMKSNKHTPWIRNYTELLEHMVYMNLDEQAQALLHKLWLYSASQNGYLPDSDQIGFKLRQEPKYIEEQIKKLSAFIEEVTQEEYQKGIIPTWETNSSKATKNLKATKVIAKETGEVLNQTERQAEQKEVIDMFSKEEPETPLAEPKEEPGLQLNETLAKYFRVSDTPILDSEAKDIYKSLNRAEVFPEGTKIPKGAIILIGEDEDMGASIEAPIDLISFREVRASI